VAAFNYASVPEVFKTFYGEKGVHNTAYEQNVALATTPKKKILGKWNDYTVQYAFAQNRSRTGSTALARPTAAKFAEFLVPTIGDYDSVAIDTKALKEAKGEGAFVDLLTNAIDGLIQSLGNNADSDIFGHRGAARGVVAVGGISTVNLTLATIEDVVHFEVGMEIKSSEDDGLTGSLQAGSATITAINRDTGVLTTDSNWTAQIATLDAGDYLFADGDFALGRAGLQDWCPDSASGLASAFYGVTRSADATRLAGIRMSGASLPIGNVIRELASRGGREGVFYDWGYCSHNIFNQFVTELDNKVIYTDMDSTSEATVGFKGINVVSGKSNIKLMPARNCPDSRIYLGKKGAFECVHSQDDVVEVEDMDGNVLSRIATDFSFDIRGQTFLNFQSTMPNNLAVATGVA
jgi:hypothetical protein